jgi:uncharacterized protein
MRRATRLFAAAFMAASSWLTGAQEAAIAQAAAAPSPGAFTAGRWSGTADLGEGPEDIVVRVAEPAAGGPGGGEAIALVDLPARSLFGYPAEDFRRDAEGMRFSILGAGPAGGIFAFRGVPARRAEGESFAVEGTVSCETDALDGGAFLLALSPDRGRGEPYSIPAGGGYLAGSLVLPDSAMGWNVPIALILSGAGEADRDGDNYNVPGKAGSLALLARELASRGVASLRYDKRGVGESLATAPAAPSFDDYVDDAASALRELANDPRFSRIVAVGHAEGALVGAAAAARELASLGGRLSGLASLCASGLTGGQILRRELAASIEGGFPGLSAEERAALAAEADAIVDSLERGEAYPDPSSELAAFFDPAAQAYYAAALRYDIRAELAAAPIPVLAVAGGSDLQVPPDEAERLLEARPDAAFRVVEGMSHALKDVGDDEEANYDSFSNPDYPLGVGLADLVAAFARGDPLPGGQTQDP